MQSHEDVQEAAARLPAGARRIRRSQREGGETMKKRMWRRLAALCLTLCMLLTCLPVSAWAVYDNVEEGTLPRQENISICSLDGADTGLVYSSYFNFEQDEDTGKDILIYDLVIKKNPEYSGGDYTYALPDYTNADADDVYWWASAAGESMFRRVFIEEGVTGIGANAFHDMQYLEYVQIPSTVTHIDANAFSGSNRAVLTMGTETIPSTSPT